MPISVASHDVMLTGGVPGFTAGQVFHTLPNSIGKRALAYPDGEIGDRRGWILALGATTWSKVDGLKEIRPT
jgi:hypothetical protein